MTTDNPYVGIVYLPHGVARFDAGLTDPKNGAEFKLDREHSRRKVSRELLDELWEYEKSGRIIISLFEEYTHLRPEQEEEDDEEQTVEESGSAEETADVEEAAFEVDEEAEDEPAGMEGEGDIVLSYDEAGDYLVENGVTEPIHLAYKRRLEDTEYPGKDSDFLKSDLDRIIEVVNSGE